MLPKQNTLKLPQRNVGFINLGNTCYANSMLQALSILPELWNQFPSEIGSTPPLLNQFLIIMTWLKRHKTSIDPSGFPRALSGKMSLIHNHPFNFNTQQDVPEILQVLLDEITGTSVLANNFLKSTIRTSISCTSCLCDSENEESISILQVPTENTISRSIQTLLKSEVLQGDNSWFCPGCQTKRESLKDSRIVTCADILVIQLKHFQLSNGHVSKDTRIVSCYPDVLKIPVHADDNITLNQQYSLVATINHSGNLQSGHYWANIKPHSSHEWLSCNDNRVAPINAESVNNATSYVLFFKKM